MKININVNKFKYSVTHLEAKTDLKGCEAIYSLSVTIAKEL